ncbi:hypothetical protein PR202_ga20323 [Eleusine coracana subsp. coracana]|uniref:Magnesium transporter n=1 Tax=Eleusine coracana subsp. coracana TaxID=191504 RepID=A0AAV5CXX3_ELECO|nr:hypothetical protein PR202_ga20323 [Eleusine coracana subsp. coracana]
MPATPEEARAPSTMASSHTAPRRRHGAATTAAAGEWAVVSGAGAWTAVEEAGRHKMMRRTGLPARDLRALDPALSSSSPHGPCSIVARDRAVVVSLDRVRTVVTAHEVLVPCPRDPAVAPLVLELRARLTTTIAADDSPSPPQEDEEGGGKDGRASSGSDKVLLPFEFRALEVCLDFACKSLEHEVRDELEHLLDDNMDMAAMHLTEKIAYKAAGHSSRFHAENELMSEFYKERGHGIKEAGDGSSFEGGSNNGSETSVRFTPKIDELEILLEAYFVQIDGTLNKLSTLREYVDDTEDYINMMLDDKQNQLLQMGIVLSTGTLVISAAVAVTGVFGINIRVPLYNTANMAVFWQATGGLVGASAAIFLVAMLCYRRSGILQ